MEPEDILEFLFSCVPLLVLIWVAEMVLRVLIYPLALIYALIFAMAFFSRIDVKNSWGPMVVAYKIGIGPYKNVRKHFPCRLQLQPGDREHFCIYYDNPDSTPEDDLRYAYGIVLASGTLVVVIFVLLFTSVASNVLL